MASLSIILICVAKWFLFIWAIVKVLDIMLEIIIERVSPADITWWLCRPFSFRSFEGIRFPMVVGTLLWIGLIIGAVWAFRSLLF